MAKLRVGMGDSYGLRFTVLASPDFDPTLVTGATFKVTRPDGSSVDWTGGLLSQTSASVQAYYAFNVSGLDLNQVGKWIAWVQWTQPGKTPGPRSEPYPFDVFAPNQ